MNSYQNNTNKNNNNNLFRSLFSRGLTLTAMFLSPSLLAGVLATNLQCGYWSDPLGVDDPNPRLSWQLQSDTAGLRSQSQTACRVLVASSTNLLANNQGDLWDSGQTNLSAPTVAYGGTPLASEQQAFWKVQVWDQNSQSTGWSSPASWTMGLLSSTNWQGHWICASPAQANLPIFLRQFTVQPGLQRAVISICGLGQYELSANGAKVGNALLAGGWSMYPKTCLYDTIDITSYLTNGANSLGVMLGNGMYNIPNSSRYAKFTGSFGPPRLIAQIHLFYASSNQVIATDTNWVTTSGPITFSSVYGGEDHDARLLPSGWSQAGFNAATWTTPVLTNGPGGTLRGQSHEAPPIQATQTLQPVAVNALSSSTIVYDLGQNAALIPTLTTHGQAGSVVQITPAETINSDGSINRNSVGGGSAYWKYTLAGTGSETWNPRFFYHGCRYLQVQLTAASGSTQLPVVDNLQGVVVQSVVPAVGNFACSIPLFNQTETLIRWAQRNNLISILTDCPHRERLGWLEEAHLNGPSLRYEFDMDKFTRCSEDAMSDSQLSNGLVPDIAPELTVFSGAFRDSPEWGSSVILVPWQQYQFTGDDALLRGYYGAMTNYLAYLTTQSSGYLLMYGLGDWYDIGSGAEGYEQLTPLGVTASAYYYQDAQTLAQIAAEIGNAGDAAKFGSLATNIAAAFNSYFYATANGFYASGSQTAQAMPLELGMVSANNQPSVLATLVANVAAQGSTSGEVGHRYLLRALSDAGRSDLVFNMNNLTNYGPNTGGYGYMLSQGATSATEGWNADPGDSLDHFMWGQIIEWFYHDLAGIQSDPSAPGFKNVIIKPALVGNVTWVNAGYNSVLGPVSSGWTLTNNQATLNVVIPPGATGRIYLPTLGTDTNNLSVQESGVTILQSGLVAGTSPGVVFADLEATAGQSYAVWIVGSGSYQFSYTVYPAPTGLAARGSTNQVALAWNPMAGVTGYNLKRAVKSGGPYRVIASGVTGTNYTDVTVADGNTYYYVVSAVWPNGESLNSFEVSAIPVQPSLVANNGFETPGVGTFQYGPSGASWTFSAQSGANGSGIAANNSYFTQANPDAPQGTQVAFLQGNGSISQSVGSFTPGSNYVVTFSAALRNYQLSTVGQTWSVTIDGNAIATFAPPVSATSYVTYTASFTATATNHTLGFVGTDVSGGDYTVFIDNVQISPLASALPAPSGLAANAGNGQVALAWNPASNATCYNMKRASSYAGTYQVVGSGVASTKFTDVTVTNGGTYYYVVSAVTPVGESLNSYQVSANPSQPTLVADFGFESPNLGGGYQYNPSGVAWTFTAQSGANGSGIAANGSAFTSGNANAPQGTQVAVLQSKSTISQAINGFIPGANYVVSFDAALRNYQLSNGGQTWNVTIDGNVIASFAPPTTATNYLNYTASFTATATNHTLAFVGTDIHGNDNTVFIDDVLVGQVVPAAPAGLTATAGNGFVSLVWNASSSAESYNLKRSLANGSYATLTTTTATNFTDVGVIGQRTYYYVVSAINASGEGTNSPVVTAMPLLATNSVPLGCQVSGGLLQFSWPINHTGWALQMQTNTLDSGLSTNWVVVPGSTLTNQFSVPIDPDNGGVFLRLSLP